MKALITASLIAATAFAGAAAATPVAPSAKAAIAHFNLDREGGDRISIGGPDIVSVSTRSQGFSGVYAHFNADADNQDGVRGLNGATVVSGQPLFAADIFARIKAEGE